MTFQTKSARTMGAVLAVVLILTLLLSGCVGISGPALPETEPKTPTAEPVSTAAQTPTAHSFEPTERTETIPQTESTEQPEPQPEPMTLEESYANVLEQYRLALADSDFTPEAYPLVNAETISELSMRWAHYSDDERAALYASYHDIDENGTLELIVTQPDSNGYLGNDIRGIYAWDGAGPVDLLKAIGCTNNDLVTITTTGMVRRVENAYYTSPAQIMEYRFDAEACQLREMHQWTYTCTDEGKCSFSGSEGTLNKGAFFAQYGTSVALEEWDAEPFISNPGTAAESPVVDLEGVPDGDGWENHLPQISLEGEVFANFNAEIRAKAQSIDEESYQYIYHGYEWSLNGDILCVRVYETYPGGFDSPWKVSRFSVSEGRELSEDELLERFGLNRAEFDAGLMPSVYGAFGRWWDDRLYSHGTFVSESGTEFAMDAMRDSSRNSAIILLDRSGRLSCYVLVGSLAGGDSYYNMVPILR